MRYFIYFSYDGTRYHGWQIQPNAVSVQEVLDQALSTILRRSVSTTGAGRTDAGVHARMMVAHFDVSEPFSMEMTELCRKLNRLLPPDISVSRIEEVAEDKHARFSATSRTYHYFIYTSKNPFLRQYAAQYTYPLDFQKMNEAAQILLETTDFTSFSKVHTDTKTNNCRVSRAEWERVGDMWRFTITADRFLRNMVRAIVGTLLEVGRGKLTLDDFRQIIQKKDRCAAAESVPANALFLVDISYD